MGERKVGDESKKDLMTEGKEVEGEEEMKLILVQKSYSQGI